MMAGFLYAVFVFLVTGAGDLTSFDTWTEALAYAHELAGALAAEGYSCERTRLHRGQYFVITCWRGLHTEIIEVAHLTAP